MFVMRCHRFFSFGKSCNSYKLVLFQQVCFNNSINRHLFSCTNASLVESLCKNNLRKVQRVLNLTQIKKYQSSMEVEVDEPREFKMKVPFGRIAGKVWNESAPVAVLCLHGWQDNAGTFDTLAPLLPKHLCLVAIDFPGHGFSSPKPLGFATLIMDYVLSVDRVVKHFGWEQVVIMGHSMGAGTGVLYSGIRPDIVHSMVMIDLIKSPHTPAEKQPSQTQRAFDSILAAEHKILNSERPSYPFEELLQRAMKSHEGSLDEAGVRTLLKRGSEKLPSGRFAFTYDLQIRTHSLISMTLEQQMAFAESLRCRLLLLKAKDGPFYEAMENYEKVLDKYRSSSREFQYLVVPGTHHTHLDTPQHVATHIADFLSLEKLGDLKNNLFKSTEEQQQRNGTTRTRVMVAIETPSSVL